ncbi:hypothetical protein Q1695_012369 [Nippostrongylus brasiliensis]|nr:hypothetical protein Q1695_012369 [Nippostrongylus brasiliensis]
MRLLFAVVVLLQLTVSVVVGLRHSLCTSSPVMVRGMDVVAASKNSVLVVVFMPLQCASCHRQLKRLALMSSSLSGVRVVVVAPNYEAPVTVSRSQTEFPRLVIDRDIDNVWRTYQAANHDQIIFDKCSRVTQVLSHPRSDMTTYRDTLDAIDRARDHSPCGPCQVGVSGEGMRINGGKVRTRMTVKQRHLDSSRLSEQHQRQQQQQLQARASIKIANYNDRNQPVDNSRRQSYPSQAQANQQSRIPQYQPISPTWGPQWNQQTFQNAPQPDPYQLAYGGQTQASSSHQVPSAADYPKHGNQAQQAATSAPQPPSPTSRPSPSGRQQSYGPDEDYEDDLIPVVQTTPALQTQIPSPTPFDPLWPTPAPGQFFLSDPRNSKKVDQRFTKFGEQASENNIPCSAYTDDICYQQQEKLGREGLSKCCQDGIYLTDVCIPGKCSNNTVQLCCFQKFLQARYRCCEDESQAVGPASTMDFSKCCYRHFVNEDDCCNAEAASNYWRSVHEVCYPNTKVDYSNIKMEVLFAEGVRVIDLNENRVWEYECRYGINRTQYAYLP